MTEWHGFKRSDRRNIALHIGPLPGRKQNQRGGMTLTLLNETDLAGIESEALLSLWGSTQQRLEEMQSDKFRLEQELKRRMVQDGAKVLQDPNYDCELKLPTPQVDVGKLEALKELLDPDTIAKGFTPAHEEVIQVKAKWDMRQVNTWGKFGDVVASVIEGAKIPGEPKLVIKIKEGEGQ